MRTNDANDPYERQRQRAIREGRGEKDRHRAALGDPEEVRPLDADRVHDRSHVIHPRLEAGDPDRAVAEAGSPLVEGGDAGKSGDAFDERAGPGIHVGKGVVEARDEPGYEHHVERALTDASRRQCAHRRCARTGSGVPSTADCHTGGGNHHPPDITRARRRAGDRSAPDLPARPQRSPSPAAAGPRSAERAQR